MWPRPNPEAERLEDLANGPVFDAFAIPALYRPEGESQGFPLRVVFDNGAREKAFEDGPGISTRAPRVTVLLADFPRGVQPAQGDYLTIRGITYSVADVNPDGFGGALLPLNRSE